MVDVAFAGFGGAVGVGEVLIQVLTEVSAPDKVSAEIAMGEGDDVGGFIGKQGEGDNQALVTLTTGDGALDQSLAKEFEDSVVGASGEMHPCVDSQLGVGIERRQLGGGEFSLGEDRGKGRIIHNQGPTLGGSLRGVKGKPAAMVEDFCPRAKLGRGESNLLGYFGARRGEGQVGLELDRFAGGEGLDGVASFRGVGGESVSILRDGGPRIVVHGDGEFRFKEIERIEGIGRSHGEIVADGEEREIEPVAADQLHIAEESGVAGMVEAFAFGFDDDAAGGAHVDGVAAGFETRGVDGGGERGSPEREIEAAARVHTVGLQTLSGKVFRDLEVGDDRGVVGFGDLGGINGVIFVSVAEDDVVTGDVFGRFRTGWVSGEEGVDQYPIRSGFNEESGVAVEGDAHRVKVAQKNGES